MMCCCTPRIPAQERTKPTLFLLSSQWQLARVNENCETACQRIAGEPCNAGPMNDVLSPTILFAISEVANIGCRGAENRVSSSSETTFTNLPQLQIRTTGGRLCQYASERMAADCSAPPSDSTIGSQQRICCCGTSANACPIEEDISPPAPTPTGGDDDETDSGNKTVILGVIGGIAAFVGVILALLASLAAAFGLGVWVGNE